MTFWHWGMRATFVLAGSVFIGVLPAQAMSITQSCDLPDLQNPRKIINKAVYQVMVREKKGGQLKARGSAIAIDHRGYFITALHVAFRFTKPNQLVLRLYGKQIGIETDRDICVNPILPPNKTQTQILNEVPSLDFAVLKADWTCSSAPNKFKTVYALPIRVHPAESKGDMSGSYIGFKQSEIGATQINRTYLADLGSIGADKDQTFLHIAPIEIGHSGAAVVSDKGVVFATIYNALKIEANRVLSSLGNLTSRPSVRSRLMAVPPSDALVPIIKAIKKNPKTFPSVVSELVMAHENLSAIDMLHLLALIPKTNSSQVYGGDFLKVIFAAQKFSKGHCLGKSFSNALTNTAKRTFASFEMWGGTAQIIRNPYQVMGIVSSAIGDLNFTKMPLKIPKSLLDTMNKTVAVPFTQGQADDAFKKYTADDAASIGRWAQKKLAVEKALTPAQKDALFEVAIGSLQVAARKAPSLDRLNAGKVSAKTKKFFDYVYTDLALATAAAEDAYNLPIRTSSWILMSSPYGNTVSATTLLADNARKSGDYAAWFNYNSHALAQLRATKPDASPTLKKVLQDSVQFSGSLLSKRRSPNEWVQFNSSATGGQLYVFEESTKSYGLKAYDPVNTQRVKKSVTLHTPVTGMTWGMVLADGDTHTGEKDFTKEYPAFWAGSTLSQQVLSAHSRNPGTWYDAGSIRSQMMPGASPVF